MTDDEAKAIRKQIMEMRDYRRLNGTRGGAPFDEQMRLCKLLEDAGHPTWVEEEDTTDPGRR